jgi:hypothetical protein
MGYIKLLSTTSSTNKTKIPPSIINILIIFKRMEIGPYLEIEVGKDKYIIEVSYSDFKVISLYGRIYLAHWEYPITYRPVYDDEEIQYQDHLYKT